MNEAKPAGYCISRVRKQLLPTTAETRVDADAPSILQPASLVPAVDFPGFEELPRAETSSQAQFYVEDEPSMPSASHTLVELLALSEESPGPRVSPDLQPSCLRAWIMGCSAALGRVASLSWTSEAVLPSGLEEPPSPEQVSNPPLSYLDSVGDGSSEAALPSGLEEPPSPEQVSNPPPLSYLDSVGDGSLVQSSSLLPVVELPLFEKLRPSERINDVTLGNIEQYVPKGLEPDVFSQPHAFTYLALGFIVPEDVFVRYALRLQRCRENGKHGPTYTDGCDLLKRRVMDTKFCTPLIVRANGIPFVVVAYKLCRQWERIEMHKWFHVQYETKRDMIRWYFTELRIPPPAAHSLKRYTAPLGHGSEMSGLFQEQFKKLRC